MEEFLTVEEVSKELNLSPYTVREMLRDGEMPGHKFGTKWRINKTEYEEWKRERRNPYKRPSQES